MDKPIEKRPLPLKPIAAFGGLGAVFIIIAYLFIFTDFDAQRVDKDDLRFGKVKFDEFEIEVSGTGKIMPHNIEWVVPRTSGDVIQLAVIDGDQVKKGQLLLELNSDELRSSLAQVESRYAQAKANLATKAFDLNAQRTRYESDLIKTKFEYEEAVALFEAHKRLMAMPNPPISRIDYTKTEIAAKRMKSLVNVSEKILANFEQLETSQLAEAQARLDEITEERAQIKQRFEGLKIVASRDGVIQDLDLKVGQRVNEGNSIAKISDPQDIYAELKIPAYQALKLSQGQKAVIELHRKHYEGKVVRIDPNVKGTTIDVDIELTQTIPDARVDMYISGVIHVQNVGKTFFVERPANSVENGQASVYKLSADGDTAELIQVSMGAFSTSHVQIREGLQPGDEIVLSDLNEFDGAERLSLY